MILKLVGVLQLILIQEISAQILARDLVIQNVLNNLENTQLAGCIRSRRQISNPTVDLPGTGNLPVQGIANGWSFNFVRGNGSPNNLPLNNGLPTSNMGLPNSSPISSMLYPFSNMNMPQNFNKLIPNGNNNNGLPINNIPNSIPRFNNFPNGLPGFNNIPNNLPPFNNIIPNGLTGFDNIAGKLPGVNNGPSGLPGFRNMPNGLPSFNNLPNEMPSFNNVPNGLPGFNSIPSSLPGINSISNGLPSFNNNLPNELPSLINIPNGLPGFNIPRGLPGVNNAPRALPSYNIIPNRLPNDYNLPGTNNFQNLINVPARNNIMNLNNLPVANSMPNINNVPIATGLTNFNDFSCGIAYPVPLKNKIPPINNNFPLQNNLQITEIGLGNRLGDFNRFPRNEPNSNVLFNPNHLGNVNRLTHQGPNEFTNINGFPTMLNTPLVTEVSNNAQSINRFYSANNFPNLNGVSNFAGEAENINMMLLNNGKGDVSHFQNYNMMPVHAQSFVSNIPFNNDFGAVNHIPANTLEQNANSRLIDAITNGVPVFNGGYLNDSLFSNNAVNTQETHVQNGDANVFSSNEVQFDNIQVPVDDLHYETVEAKLPDTQIILPEGVHMITNVPSEYQPGLMSNSISLAKELVENLQIEGLKSMPFLNGLPVAGITETVTVLNR